MVSDPWGGVKGGIAVYELYRLCHREGNTNMLLSSLVWLGQRIEYHFAGNWPELDDDFCTRLLENCKSKFSTTQSIVIDLSCF